MLTERYFISVKGAVIMFKERNFRLSMSLIFNIAIIVLEIIGTVICASNTGIEMFTFYTTDSNLFAMAVSIIYAFYTARCLFSEKKQDIPKPVKTLKYISVCCLNLTFLVVIAIFAPASGEGGYEYMLFNGDFFYFHFSCPLLTLISFILFEGDTQYELSYSFAAVIPTLIYAAAAVALNLLRVIEGPYPFLYVYDQPVTLSVMWFIMIADTAFLSSSLIQKLGSTFACSTKKRANVKSAVK